MIATSTLLADVQTAGEDREWYPTSPAMIAAVLAHLPADAASLMDIGAGDGRVLAALAEKCTRATLYGIEQSTVLVQAQPDNVIPVGTEFHEQNLACLPVDYIFCNPPYSEFEAWTARIIEAGHAKRAYLVIPQRWKDSVPIKAALERRGARAKSVFSGDFLDADRRARAVVNVVEVSYPMNGYGGYRDAPLDPFDIWFDQNISTFDPAADEPDEPETSGDLARRYRHSNIGDMVAAYTEEYARLEANYRAIFALDRAILGELGVTKEHVRDGIKKKMQGLKAKYWEILFSRLDALTSRLCTKTREKFIERLTKNTSVGFSMNNAYAVVLWAIKNANRYYDEQLVDLFRELTATDCVQRYKSNQQTWGQDRWRYRREEMTHYALDYRIVTSQYQAIQAGESWRWEYIRNLSRSCHNLIADIVAVMSNLDFRVVSPCSTDRQWERGEWQDFRNSGGDVVFQVKAYQNGNLHLRFMPDAIKALNVEAGRLTGWLKSVEDVVSELGYEAAEAERFFGASLRIGPSSVKMLGFEPAHS